MNCLSKFSRSAPWLVALALLAPLWGQTPGQGQEKGMPLSKVERKNRAPVSKEVLRVKLPRPVETTLENGLTLLVLEDRRLPTILVNLQVSGAGPIHEPSDRPGLAWITAQMMREGTKTRNSRQIAEQIEQLGASITVSSPFGSSGALLSASGLSDNFDTWFALAADILLNPSFAADELQRLRERQKAALRNQRSQPGFLASERFSRAVFGSHPAAVVSPTVESLDALTPEMLAAWHKERYVPQLATMGIAGDISASEAIAKVKKWLGGWTKTDLKLTLPPDPKPAETKKIYLVDRPGSVQTTVTMGNIAVKRTDPDYFAVLVMNRVVGQGPASRLFLNLREEKGYTYGVYSGFTALRYPGPWQAGGDMRTEVTEGAMTEFLREIARIRDEKVPEAELEEAKRSVVANFALQLEQPAAVLSNWIIGKLYDLPADYWDTYPARVMAITADEVQRVARKYIVPEALQIAAVGDGGKIKAVLEKFGAVEVFDSEGRPVRPAVATTPPPNP